MSDPGVEPVKMGLGEGLLALRERLQVLFEGNRELVHLHYIDARMAGRRPIGNATVPHEESPPGWPRRAGARARLLMLALAVMTQGCASRAAEVELLLAPVPSTLTTGATGALEVRMVASQPIAQARLSAWSAPAGLTITPEAFEIGELRPPGGSAGQPQSPPNPPALGVVPIRTFALKGERAGTYQVTVELSGSGGAVRQTIEIGVNE